MWSGRLRWWYAGIRRKKGKNYMWSKNRGRILVQKQLIIHNSILPFIVFSPIPSPRLSHSHTLIFLPIFSFPPRNRTEIIYWLRIRGQ